MGWRLLYQVDAVDSLVEAIESIANRIKNNLGGTIVGEYVGNVDVYYRKDKADTKSRGVGAAAPAIARKMCRVAFSDPKDSEYFVLEETDVVETSHDFGKILDNSHSAIQKRHTFRVQGLAYRVSDFVVRFGALSAPGFNKNSAVLEIEYEACAVSELASPIINEFAICLIGPLYSGHQNKKKVARVRRVAVRYEDLKLSKKDLYSQRHRAAQYAQYQQMKIQKRRREEAELYAEA